jgi:hypothetical protein
MSLQRNNNHMAGAFPLEGFSNGAIPALFFFQPYPQFPFDKLEKG